MNDTAQLKTIDALLRGDRLFLDVRAPLEFRRGRAPHAINLPILTDAERHRIGITYKQQGAAAAEKLGYRLVAGDQRQARINGWQAILERHADAVLGCWRGGSRSQIAAGWLADQGYEPERLHGGYRALRQRSTALLSTWPGQAKIVLLGGRTGVGKTQLLARLNHFIDLEGLAQHRGSAFGQIAADQPTPTTFENALAGAVLRHALPAPVLLEDESRTIGRLALPDGWFDAMSQAPIVLLEAPLEARVELIEQDYLRHPLSMGQTEAELFQRYDSALGRIRKRLGGLRYQQIRAALLTGFTTGNHHSWIEQLLVGYYDPSYDFQLRSKAARIVFRGQADDVVAHWELLTGHRAPDGEG